MRSTGAEPAKSADEKDQCDYTLFSAGAREKHLSPAGARYIRYNRQHPFFAADRWLPNAGARAWAVVQACRRGR
jgi:hypothetical protein